MRCSDEEFEHHLELCEFLPQNKKEAIENVAIFGLGVCSKCRWASGCLKCDPEKCIRYHLSKEGLVPKAKGIVNVPQTNSEGIKTGGGDDFPVADFEQAL